MNPKLYQVDSFTNEPFKGNPAGVCLLDQAREDAWMQNVAIEMNLSETAFLYKEKDAYRLRWFTPGTEVDLCGHATLATAHILWETGLHQKDETLSFNTRSGVLKADNVEGWIELDFPAIPVEKETADQSLLEALQIKPVSVNFARGSDYLIEIDSVDTLKQITPDFELLKKSKGRGVIVTCRSDRPGYDFISRFFAPNAGVNEDPVTGSAHCALATFWAEKLGKTEFSAWQASRRGGELKVVLAGERVKLRGQAVTIFETELKI